MKNLIFIALFLSENIAIAQLSGQTESYPLNKIGYNSAYIANNGKASFTAIGQYGKNAEPGSLKNYYLALETPISKNLGAAIQFSNYSNLLFNNKTITIGFSNKIKLGETSSISIGLSAGAVNTKYDFETDYGLSIVKEAADFKTSTDFPSSTKAGNINQFAENQYVLGAGIFLNASSWHFGFAIPNILKNEIPVDISTITKVQLERPAYLSVEKDFNLNQKWKLTAGSLYRFSKNEYQKGLDINTAFWFDKKYSLGIWQQRLGSKSGAENKPLLAVAEVIVNKVRLAYSFNLTNNSANYTNIKQQILLRLDIDYLKKKQNNNAQSFKKQTR